jgi:Tol biopolymer transport system component
VTIELDSAIPVGSIIKKSGLDISTDGKYVLSDHSHLGEFSLINTEEQSETLLSYSFSLSGSESKLSADGRFVLFQKGHHISYAPLHIYDTKTAQTTVLSVATNGSNEPTRVSMGNFAVSGDGRYITFVSREGALYGEVPVWGSYGKPEVIVYDRVAHQAATVNEGQYFHATGGSKNSLDISEDGHYIVFNNYVATNPFFISSQYCEGYEEF